MIEQTKNFDRFNLANKIADSADVTFDYVGWNRKSFPRGREAYQRFFEALDTSHLTFTVIYFDGNSVSMRGGKIIEVLWA